MSSGSNDSPWRGLWPLLAVVVVVNFLTMPAQEYSFDATAARISSIAFITTGKFAVGTDIAAQCGERGQYLYEKSDGIWYPKYGVLNTLIYIPCLWLDQLVTGKLGFASDRTLALNLFNLVLSAASALYLWLLARRYTDSIGTAWLFVMACLYCTFWWNYLRAQTFEIYVTLLMVAFVYHFLSAQTAGVWPGGDRKHRVHLLSSAVALGLLCLCKTLYVVLLPVVLTLFLLGARADAGGQSRRWLRQLVLFGLPIALFLAALLATNWYRFGSPFATGYTQFVVARQTFTANLIPALRGFLLGPQKSLFLHFPVFFLALPGWVGFARKYRWDAITIALIGLVVFLVVSAYVLWRGGAGYGPRYLLPILPLLSLPFVHVLEWIRRRSNAVIKWACYALIAVSLGYSFLLQIGVNTLPFFFRDELDGVLDAETSAYAIDLVDHHHFGVINIEFMLYARDAPAWRMRRFVNELDSAEFGRLVALKAETKMNYFWFPYSIEKAP